jgi:hypothetical protein
MKIIYNFDRILTHSISFFTANGGIDEEEFIAMSNMIIKECVEFNE